MSVGTRVYQLRCHADLVAGFANRAFEHVRDIDLLRNLGNHVLLAFERECRGPRNDAQFGYFREQVQQFLGQAIREIFLARIIAHVHERQHNDGLVAKCTDNRIATTLLPCRLNVRGVAGRIEHKLVDREIADGEREHDDDDAIENLGRGSRCSTIDVRVELQSIRRELKHPRRDHGGNKSDGEDDYDHLDRCRGYPEDREQRLEYLDQEPGTCQVGDGYTDNVAT